MLKFNAKVGEWGSGLRFKSRSFRICLYLRKDTSRGYTCLSGHFSSWSENCIFPYDEVDTHILMFFLHSATSIIIFLTNSVVGFFGK